MPPPRKLRLPPEESLQRAVTRMSYGTVQGRIESASPVNRLTPIQSSVPLVGGSHTHDAAPALTTIVGGDNEQGSAVPVALQSSSVVIGDWAYSGSKGTVVIGTGSVADPDDGPRVEAGAGLNIVICAAIGSLSSLYENGSIARGYSDIIIGAASETVGDIGENLLLGHRNKVGVDGWQNILVGFGDIGDKNEVAGTGDMSNNILIGGLGMYAGGDLGFGLGINVVLDDGTFDTIGIGDGPLIEADHGIGIGTGVWVKATHEKSIALGYNATTSDALQLAVAPGMYLDFDEFGNVPANADAGHGRLFLQDDGSGKMQFAAIFPSGAIQVIATEP